MVYLDGVGSWGWCTHTGCGRGRPEGEKKDNHLYHKSQPFISNILWLWSNHDNASKWEIIQPISQQVAVALCWMSHWNTQQFTDIDRHGPQKIDDHVTLNKYGCYHQLLDLLTLPVLKTCFSDSGVQVSSSHAVVIWVLWYNCSIIKGQNLQITHIEKGDILLNSIFHGRILLTKQYTTLQSTVVFKQKYNPGKICILPIQVNHNTTQNICGFLEEGKE